MYKGPWTKPKGDRIEGGRWGWVRWGGIVGGKRRKLYLNNKYINTYIKILSSVNIIVKQDL